MKRHAFLLLLLLLTACQPLPTTLPPETPAAISLTYPPELRAWADLLLGCASATPGLALYRHESTAPAAPASQAEISLALGNLTETDASLFAYAIGKEPLLAITNIQNPQTNLSTADLQALFSGRLLLWQNGRPAQIWVYPAESPLQNAFRQIALDGESPTTQALLAPDPAAMLTAVASNPDALGFVPQSSLWQADSNVWNSVVVLEIDASLAEQMQQTVLVLTSQEPQGDLYTLLACAQAGYIP